MQAHARCITTEGWIRGSPTLYINRYGPPTRFGYVLQPFAESTQYEVDQPKLHDVRAQKPLILPISAPDIHGIAWQGSHLGLSKPNDLTPLDPEAVRKRKAGTQRLHQARLDFRDFPRTVVKICWSEDGRHRAAWVAREFFHQKSWVFGRQGCETSEPWDHLILEAARKQEELRAKWRR
jgi:hypothetical protein